MPWNDAKRNAMTFTRIAEIVKEFKQVKKRLVKLEEAGED